jgi:hypothetical protein
MRGDLARGLEGIAFARRGVPRGTRLSEVCSQNTYVPGTRSTRTKGEQGVVPFDHEELRYLRDLEQQLRRIEDWPLDSPLAFVIHLAPRTKGRLGELFLDAIAKGLSVETRPSGSADFDRLLVCADGATVSRPL